jgi:hypothetical protein
MESASFISRSEMSGRQIFLDFIRVGRSCVAYERALSGPTGGKNINPLKTTRICFI